LTFDVQAEGNDTDKLKNKKNKKNKKKRKARHEQDGE